MTLGGEWTDNPGCTWENHPWIKQRKRESMNGKRVLGLTLTVMAVAAMGWPVSRAWPEGKAQGGRSDPFEETWKPFFQENCAGCHNAKQAAGGLNLEEYQNGVSVLAHRETWENVWQRLVAGEMPPKGAPRPDPAAVKAVTGWLEGEFARADRAMRPNAGRVTARRLNRAEYDNTIRDLLGVDLGLAEEFPQDDSGYGFDTIGDVLSLPPVLMEKYLVAAERAAKFGLREIEVRVKGPGSGRESAITALQQSGLTIKAIEDVTPLPHNGCRPPKKRRV